MVDVVVHVDAELSADAGSTWHTVQYRGKKLVEFDLDRLEITQLFQFLTQNLPQYLPLY